MKSTSEPAIENLNPLSLLNDADFRSLLTLNPEDGRMWLADRRVMLLYVSSFADIRKELIEVRGLEGARRFFTTLGYRIGAADAELLRRRWPDHPERHVYSPYLFYGMTHVESLSVERDSKGHEINHEWHWHHSVEADAHIQSFGLSDYPACWINAGYYPGFFSETGRLILTREVACRAMGASICRVVTRSSEYWSDSEREEILSYLDVPLAIKKCTKRPGVQLPPQDIVLPPSTASGQSRTIVGQSPSLKAALQLLQAVADTDATVMITGESGVGKELFTRELHALSSRATQSFVAVNCAAIPDTLVEAELFGVERGAFTGANTTRPGRFERAQGGTLFLDEIGSLNPVSQTKLLRALQEGEIDRVGGTRPIKVNVRVVAATNTSLVEAMDEGLFRKDLFYRLNVFPIHLPPLRERRDDIPALLQHYLALFNARHRKSVPGFTRAAMDALLQYRFPGNVRELENLVERAVILAKNGPIDRGHIFVGGEVHHSKMLSLDRRGKLKPDHAAGALAQSPAALDQQLQEVAKTLLTATEGDNAVPWPELQSRLMDVVTTSAMARSGGSVSAAARLLGMERHQLAYHLKRRGED